MFKKKKVGYLYEKLQVNTGKFTRKTAQKENGESKF